MNYYLYTNKWVGRRFGEGHFRPHTVPSKGAAFTYFFLMDKSTMHSLVQPFVEAYTEPSANRTGLAWETWELKWN